MGKTGKHKSYARQAPCSSCGVKYAVRKDGKMRKHINWDEVASVGRVPAGKHCPGSNKPPQGESVSISFETRDAVKAS